MNDQQRAAIQMALEALESKYIVNCGAWRIQQNQAITALREALAQPQDQGENNGQRNDHGNTKYSVDNGGNLCSNSDSEAIECGRAPECFTYRLVGELPEGVHKLYATPPSVEAMRIETLEKAAKFLETTDICGDAVMDELAAAIRGMK